MVNRQNYHLRGVYLQHLLEVMQLNPTSIVRYKGFLRHLLVWADETPFSEVEAKRPTLPAYLLARGQDADTTTLRPATIKKVLHTSQRLFRWARLAYPEDFGDLPEAWIATLRAPRMVQPMVEHNFVTLEEVLALTALPTDPARLSVRRDQAAAALLYLSGIRAGALGSLPISAVDIATRSIKQWPSMGVHTKNSKTATTYLLPIPELLAVVEAWDTLVRSQLPETAMWYTTLANDWGISSLSPARAGTSRNVTIGKQLRLLYKAAGLPCKSPHKFRHGHAVWALQHAATMADYKAVSQNLMHSDIRITDSIYAPLLGNEVQQRITNLSGGTAPLVVPSSEAIPALAGLSKSELLAILQQAIAQLTD